VNDKPSEFDLAAARLLRETRDRRDEARQLGHEHLALLLGQARLKLIEMWERVIASENPDGEPGGQAGPGQDGRRL
jgi:hypothetical protein